MGDQCNTSHGNALQKLVRGGLELVFSICYHPPTSVFIFVMMLPELSRELLLLLFVSASLETGAARMGEARGGKEAARGGKEAERSGRGGGEDEHNSLSSLQSSSSSE